MRSNDRLFMCVSCGYPWLFMAAAYVRLMQESPTNSSCARCDALRARRDTGYCCVGAGEYGGGPQLADGLPMAQETLHALERRAAALEERVKRLAPTAASEALEGIANGAFFVASRQLSALERALGRARVVQPDGCALVGSRVVVQPSDAQELVDVELAAPDLADPGAGRISVDSPLGAALVGRRRGETVRFYTPAGMRTVRLTAIT